MTELAPIEKLRMLVQGTTVICSDDDLDAMAPFDKSNFIRTRPNPARCGTKDTWEAWIERKDVQRLNSESQ